MINDSEIILRKTEITDLEYFFIFQLDKEANYLAAFTSKDPTDKSAYLQKYSKFVNDPTINMQTIIVENMIAGSIAKFEIEGEAGITYWIDKKFWGRGIATKALQNFLKNENMRPIFGHVAFDNFRSQKVLEKCNFIRIGRDKGFANARQAETEEFIYKLTQRLKSCKGTGYETWFIAVALHLNLAQPMDRVDYCKQLRDNGVESWKAWDESCKKYPLPRKID